MQIGTASGRWTTRAEKKSHQSQWETGAIDQESLTQETPFKGALCSLNTLTNKVLHKNGNRRAALFRPKTK